jgi:hypothetical protein
MSTSFAQLKSTKSSFDTLNSQLQKLSSGQRQSYGDDRIWKPEVDKAKNGYAVLRFLPAPENEDMPFVRLWDHGFQGPGGWYIENSLTSLGQEDPASEYNSTLWNSGVESDKDIARKQKRRLKYFSNVYIVHDPAKPSNEGKVFLFQYGKKIFDKLNEAMNPQYPDEKPVNPFDLWAGANFQLKIRDVEGYRNYDRSEFTAPVALSECPHFKDGGTDDELEAIWKSQYSLQELVDPKNFKSYNELKSKLYRVLGLDGGMREGATSAENDEPTQMDFKPNFKAAEAAEPKVAEAVDVPWKTEAEDDDTLSFFKKLAEDD